MAFLNIEAVRRFAETVSQNDQKSVVSISQKLAAGQAVEAGERDQHTLDGVALSDIREAALCISVLLNTAVDVRKALGVRQKKRGPKGENWGGLTQVEIQKIEHLRASLVVRHVAGEINRTATEREIAKIWPEVSVDTIKRFIKAYKPIALQELALRNQMKAIIDGKINK